MPFSERKCLRWSRKAVHRARLREKKPEVVTQERPTCPPLEEKARGGQARPFILPVSGRKSPRWSRKAVHRARLREKKAEVVTQERPTYPPPDEKAGGGHAGT